MRCSTFSLAGALLLALAPSLGCSNEATPPAGGGAFGRHEGVVTRPAAAAGERGERPRAGGEHRQRDKDGDQRAKTARHAGKCTGAAVPRPKLPGAAEEGIDFAQLDAQGRLQRVTGFFGPLPALEAAA